MTTIIIIKGFPNYVWMSYIISVSPFQYIKSQVLDRLHLFIFIITTLIHALFGLPHFPWGAISQQRKLFLHLHHWCSTLYMCKPFQVSSLNLSHIDVTLNYFLILSYIYQTFISTFLSLLYPFLCIFFLLDLLIFCHTHLFPSFTLRKIIKSQILSQVQLSFLPCD